MNYKNVLILTVLLFQTSIIFCADNKYKVSDIPAELKENAKAVIRYESIEFEIFTGSKAVQKVNIVTTILNKNGLFNSFFIQFYDKFSRISNISGKIYNENGEFHKRFQLDDILDYSAIDGYTLYADSRVKFINPKYEIYPYTVEYSYEIHYNGCLAFPDWRPYRDYNISVQESEFRVVAPSAYHFRYLERNMNPSCVKTSVKEKTNYYWQEKNLKAIIKEDYSMELSDYVPVVQPAPSDFEIGGFKGNSETWQNFGKWIGELNQGKDQLDEETGKHIVSLVAGIDNEKDKLKILYQFMQNKTRYVSIQVGIGGWQPFDAKIVDKNSYGDCKALSNYMKAVLKVAGINSYYTLIRAGADSPAFIAEFPSNQFNHAILCVPVENDTVWLECTSQHAPFGYLGTFTDDRPALLIADSGGVLVHTPVYTSAENIKHTKVVVNFEKDGIWSQAEISIYQGGMFYDKMSGFIMSDEVDKKKFIESNIGLSGFEITGYNYKEEKTRKPGLNLNLSVKLNKQGTLLNDRLIVPINLMNKMRETPGKTAERKSDILIRRSYRMIDSITYHIPAGYKVDQIPKDQYITSAFGNFSMQVIPSDQSFCYIRQLEMNQGTYPATDYEKFTGFFREIEKCDNAKFVLRKTDIP